MKCRLRLLTALVLGAVLLSLTSSDSMAQQGRRRFSADSGIVTLGPNQKLRVAISGDFDGDADVDVADFVFRRIGYIEQDNIYRVASQATTDPIRLTQGGGASIDINQGEFDAVRCVVSGNLIGTDARSARVTVQVINRTTNQVDSVLIALLLP
jgi:hypothetical protein